MTNNKSANSAFQNKKQVKKELAHNIETALPEIKLKLGEKKFNKRLKKATKLLTEGLHLKNNGKQKNNVEKNEQAQDSKTPIKKNANKNKAG